MSELKPRLPLIAAPAVGRRVPKLRLVDALPTAVPGVATDARTSGTIWARKYRTRLRITDFGIIVIAVTVALLARFGISESQVSVGSGRVDYWTITVLIIGTWLLTLGAFHTRDARVVGVGAAEYKQVINASALAFGLLAIAFLIFQVDIARGYFILALPLGVTGLMLERWLWRKWLLHQRHFGHYLARAIVVGNRNDVEYVVRQIGDKSGAAYHVVGVALEAGDSAAVSACNRQVPVVADHTTVAAAAAELGVDTVIVAGQPSGGSRYIRNLGWGLEGTSAELVLSSQLTDVAGPRIHFRPVEGLPLIHVEIPRFEGSKHVMKRTFDAVAAGFGLIMLLPLLLLIALLIKLDSPGPVLFRQERCGRNQRTFQMLKFRSMVQTAEDDLEALMELNEGSGVLFKMRNDPRVTPLGQLLRKYSLDELPQLWNVLLGHMSLVGPRPPLPREVQGYEEHVHRRLYIKPGLTGMWQVNGRSDLSWEESVRLDLYYVENWSVTGDLLILWRTLRVLTHPRGAY